MNHLDYRRYSLPLLKPLRTAHGPMTEREGLLIRLRDAEGRAGYGEAAPLVGFGQETCDADEEVLRELGLKPSEEDLAGIPASAECVRSAISAAQAGLLASMPTSERSVPSSAAAPAPWPVAALLPAGKAAFAEVEGRLELGFRVFKWKVGVGDAADEMGMLDDLLGRLPSGAKLRLDANGAWDRRRAERWLERCADRPIEHVEQPISPDARGSVDLLCGLAGDFPTPIALDESLVGQRAVDTWLGLGWPGIFVLKLSLLGAPQEVVKKLATARAKVVFSSALETGIGARAALRWAFSWTAERRALGFGVWPLFQDARFDGPFHAPFLRWSDVERIDPESQWNALS